MRQEIKSVAERWKRTTGHLREDTQAEGAALAELVKEHASEAFFGCNSPAEAALFSVLVELQKARDTPGGAGRHNTGCGETMSGRAGGEGNLDP